MTGYQRLHSHSPRLMPGAPAPLSPERHAKLLARMNRKRLLKANAAAAWLKAEEWPEGSEGRAYWTEQMEKFASELEALQ